GRGSYLGTPEPSGSTPGRDGTRAYLPAGGKHSSHRARPQVSRTAYGYPYPGGYHYRRRMPATLPHPKTGKPRLVPYQPSPREGTPDHDAGIPRTYGDDWTWRIPGGVVG